MPEGHLLHRLARDGRMVYKQAASRARGTPAGTWDVAGRVAYACPTCQAR